MAIPVQVVFCLSEKLRMPLCLLIFFSDKQRSSQVSLHSLLPQQGYNKDGNRLHSTVHQYKVQKVDALKGEESQKGHSNNTIMGVSEHRNV